MRACQLALFIPHAARNPAVRSPSAASQPSSNVEPCGSSELGAFEAAQRLSATGGLSKWFPEELQAHGAQLKSYLRGSFPSVRDVDDLVQESYLRVWRRQARGPLACVRSFLYKVARNLAIDALRRDARSPFEQVSDLAGLNVLDNRPNAADAACTSDELTLLLEAIESLPTRCREVVVLHKLCGLAPADIARELGISEGTVHVQGAKGVRRCEEFLRERGVVRKGKP